MRSVSRASARIPASSMPVASIIAPSALGLQFHRGQQFVDRQLGRLRRRKSRHLTEDHLTLDQQLDAGAIGIPSRHGDHQRDAARTSLSRMMLESTRSGDSVEQSARTASPRAPR